MEEEDELHRRLTVPDERVLQRVGHREEGRLLYNWRRYFRLPATLLLAGVATVAVLHWARWVAKPMSTDGHQAKSFFSMSSNHGSKEEVTCRGDENEDCSRNMIHCLGNVSLQKAVARCEDACKDGWSVSRREVDVLETCLRLFQEKRQAVRVCVSQAEGKHLMQFPDELRQLVGEMESLHDEMSQCLSFTSSITVTTSLTTSLTTTSTTNSATSRTKTTRTQTTNTSTSSTSISTLSTSTNTTTSSTQTSSTSTTLTTTTLTTTTISHTSTSVTQTMTSTQLGIREYASKGSPKQIRLRSNVEYCLSISSTFVQNGEPVHLARCEDSKYTATWPHMPLCKPFSSSSWWLIDDEEGKIYFASNPRFCLTVKDSSSSDGTPLQLWECTSPNVAQAFEVASKIQWASHRDKCLSVNSDLGAPLHIDSCHESDKQEFAFHSEHCPERNASFLVLGDWGWDAYIHGKGMAANSCQRAIADLMLVKMQELGDVKFVVNVGDSFYPDGLSAKDDPQWDTKWRNIYSKKLRSVPWYSVYGNHDYHSDPGACSSDPAEGLQINADVNKKDVFYMPDYTYFVEHPELNLEVLGMDSNNLSLEDCSRSSCPAQCEENLKARANQSMELFNRRLRDSRAKNFVTFSHYPSDFFWRNSAFLDQLRSSTSNRSMAYFGGHRHNTDQKSTARTGPHDWLVGGGGGWSCDGQEQGFLVAELDQEFNLRTYPVLVPPSVCCPR